MNKYIRLFLLRDISLFEHNSCKCIDIYSEAYCRSRCIKSIKKIIISSAYKYRLTRTKNISAEYYSAVIIVPLDKSEVNYQSFTKSVL